MPKQSKIEKLGEQPCPVCNNKTLTLMQEEVEVPFFGKTLVFSMKCSGCNYSMSDVEALEKKEPSKYTLDIDNEKDMNIKIVKSSTATVKIPYITDIEPGQVSEGYITTVEGLFNRVKAQVEHIRDSAEDDDERNKAKNLVKKITRIRWGQEKAKIIIEDPNGNSAIISDKAKKSKL